ncbi:flagellar P-ring protein FlgI [Cupriavidus metallidurans]|uniref:Flagellar P-ring protein n=1 Tax=Cupriavidus metallidurans (strain ATCC 43123 / DSM 2839 / NBRC 102507 / CH34) TaxID=266264 RepID=Q1LGW3_CUPMC|nr:flagellar basal body P-ring protein FlgI [Cupriavidus metallidurans]ABF10613.1 flagellar basal body P-ring protein [Cupriavidus metallidurans CH34]AVA37836.1 flagellar basal body P-ring protein FlgI [Cupriavidus metallidurans]KWW35380.1 Flagellar P-ring protein [Cupriavidus metallidurans]MDE4921526.1 flagellar basal body P-ring protein FlgI [Cupriavidus metallidurans]QGS31912.1 flagellar basal body P-ring protein FlgI [Cupriavidus metallidurans]
MFLPPMPFHKPGSLLGTPPGLHSRSGRAVFLAGLLLALFLGLGFGHAHAERLKNLATFQGVRDNPLVGYGLVVGLDNTGDQTMQTPFTTQSLQNMLSQLGITLPAGKNMQLKNVAAVMVTAALPAYAQPGSQIDVVVSSMGNAKSLRGGTLLMTPLKGIDGQVYAVAQGNMLVGGAGASANGSKVQINQLAVGRIANGAIVERAVPSFQPEGGFMNLELKDTDFGTVERVVEAINRNLGAGTAAAMDGRVVQVRTPQAPSARVGFMARIENLDVTPAKAAAKVILNARTGSIVMNQAVTVEDCAIAHGNLSVVINTQPVISQPGPFSQGQTVVAPVSQIDMKQGGGSLQIVKAGASLAAVVKGLNALGATPADLQTILEAMRAAGALRAELEII